jgi:hypothetical protein
MGKLAQWIESDLVAFLEKLKSQRSTFGVN